MSDGDKIRQQLRLDAKDIQSRAAQWSPLDLSSLVEAIEITAPTDEAAS